MNLSIGVWNFFSWSYGRSKCYHMVLLFPKCWGFPTILVKGLNKFISSSLSAWCQDLFNIILELTSCMFRTSVTIKLVVSLFMPNCFAVVRSTSDHFPQCQSAFHIWIGSWSWWMVRSFVTLRGFLDPQNISNCSSVYTLLHPSRFQSSYNLWFITFCLPFWNCITHTCSNNCSSFKN